MENNKEINNRLDELFARARTDKPVTGVDEVRKLIATVTPAGTATSGKSSSKSNLTLYMLIGGLSVIALTTGIWYFTNDNDGMQQHQQVAAVTEIETPTENNAASTTPSGETNEQVIPADKTAATDLAATDESASSANAETPADHKESKTTANNPKTETGIKVNEPAPASSANKTYIETGGDFIVNFKTEDNSVKLKFNDNDVKELMVDGAVISKNDYPKYKELIDKGKKMMDAERSKPASVNANAKTPEEQKRDDLNTRLFNAFTDQLKKDKLIDEDKYSFKLTSSELLIDGKQQPEAVKQKYVELFKNITGRDLGGTTFKFDHGMN